MYEERTLRMQCGFGVPGTSKKYRLTWLLASSIESSGEQGYGAG